ncbi:MAG TPA: cell envelope integrity protein TolA [Thermodesulfovibrionales bacterium]|nr:cell envelope integrity protein TolA [Thermodesulfovibrionales bacterium]
MRGPSLQTTAALSFVLHISVFLLMFLVFKQSHHIALPDHYTVNLVSVGIPQRVERVDTASVEDKRGEMRQKEPSAAPEPRRKSSKEDRYQDAKEKESIEQKISLMAAKKRLQTRVGARHIISLKAGREKPLNSVKAGSAKAGASRAYTPPSSPKGVAQADDYYLRVVDEIRQQWVWSPSDSGRRNIEAVVSIRILRDGTAIIQRWEKKSGDSVFDKSALRALAKASPLSPPPYEMEIGVRFYP